MKIFWGICGLILFLLEGVGHTAPAEERQVFLRSRLWSRPNEKTFVLEEVLKPFERECGCRVRFEVSDDQQLFEQVRHEMDSEQLRTDVVIAYCSQMQDWAEAGYVTDLGPLLHEWSDRSFPRALADMTIFHGRRYFVPVGADVYLLIVNKKALKYLPAGINVQNISWEELVDWALISAEAEGEGKFALSGMSGKMLTYQYAGLILSYRGAFPDLNSKGALDAWRLLLRMKPAYAPKVMAFENVIEPMKQQETWFAVAHCARVGAIYTSQPSQFLIAPPPAGPAGMGSIAGTSGIGILKGAPHPELAEQLVEYLSRADIQMKLAVGTGGFIPPVNEALELLDGKAQDEIIRKALYVMDRGVLAFIPSSFGPMWNAVKEVYEQAFRRIVFEKGQIDTSWLNNAQETIDSLEIQGLLLKSSAPELE